MQALNGDIPVTEQSEISDEEHNEILQDLDLIVQHIHLKQRSFFTGLDHDFCALK